MTRDLEVPVPVGSGSVPALLDLPADASWLYVLAHGAGAGMRHRFMADVASRLGAAGVGTLRYEFPYMARGSRRPDPAATLTSCVRAVATWASRAYPDLRLVAGGKSMGGRMTSQAQAESGLDRVEGLVFLGFPLHPAGAPATGRAAHLAAVTVPMLFLQGTRDALADLGLMEPVVGELGTRAALHIIEGADHGFAVPRRSGRTAEDVMAELVGRIVAFTDHLASGIAPA